MGRKKRAAVLFKRVAFVVVGACVALAVLGVANGFGFNPFQVQQADRSHPAVLMSIQKLSRYTAVSGNFEKVIDDKDDDAPWVPSVIPGRRTLFVAVGTVDAYVDLSGLADKDLTLSEDGKSVTVRLPEPQLGKPNLNHARSYVVDTRTVFDRISDFIEPHEQAQFYLRAEKELTAAAEKTGLREQAAKNTRAMLTGTFDSLGIHAIFLDNASG